ncbi:MAG TPA: BTAD domain-containing putative transcriptional regulator, partial [Anaerolineae bacterium]
MPEIALYLLGSPRLERNGTPVELDTRKAMALLAYLVVTGEGHTRDALAALLWPELDESRARAALRRTLSPLRQALGKKGLHITREAVAIHPDGGIWTDVTEFRRLLAEPRTHGHPPDELCPRCLEPLRQAAELYRDDFLAGFGLRDSVNFDEWQYFQSESLRRDFAGALEKLARGYSARGDFEPAIGYARRWLALDPLREEAHRQLMQLYAWAGQRPAALRQYRECVRILEEELGVPPLPETTALYERIQSGDLTPAPPLPRTPIPMQ